MVKVFIMMIAVANVLRNLYKNTQRNHTCGGVFTGTGVVPRRTSKHPRVYAVGIHRM